MPLDPRSLPSLRRRLLAWFDRNRRVLPWRLNRDPYRIWVSEVMLQQTTVAAVVPKFEQFLTAFPTLMDLAAASEHDVLRHWEGLGYYRRARHLHAAAVALVADHSGTLPDDPAVWDALPGVGRYILGAVLSQAFDRRMPIVEANSLRVLCRLFGQTGDPKSGPIKEWLWETAESLLPAKRVGDFNQALMELGALICTPNGPKCGHCPLAEGCVAKRDELQESIPVKTKPPLATDVREVGILVRRAEKLLLCRRPASGRWSNMWELPHGELTDGETHIAAAKRLLKGLTGVSAAIGAEWLTVRHTVTRFRITLVCLEADYRGGEFRSHFYTDARWVTATEMADYPVSSPQRRIAESLVGEAQTKRLF